jgi:hypothetical protein
LALGHARSGSANAAVAAAIAAATLLAHPFWQHLRGSAHNAVCWYSTGTRPASIQAAEAGKHAEPEVSDHDNYALAANVHREDVVKAAANATATACRHFFVAVGVDSEEDCRLAFPGRNRYNGGICPNHLPVGHVRVAARVTIDLWNVVFLNAYACVGKEVNAKVTGTDVLPMRVDLKNENADHSYAARTDRSIWNLVFCTLDYQLLEHEHGHK